MKKLMYAAALVLTSLSFSCENNPLKTREVVLPEGEVFLNAHGAKEGVWVTSSKGYTNYTRLYTRMGVRQTYVIKSTPKEW